MKVEIRKALAGYDVVFENCCAKNFPTKHDVDMYLIKVNATKYKNGDYLMLPTGLLCNQYDFFYGRNGIYYKIQDTPAFADRDAAIRFLDSKPKVFVL